VSTRGAHFEAQFEGDCAECAEPIDIGDEVGWVDEEVVCRSCYDAAAE
jgi:formylmethanofuran dehydrogenase subunit E